MGGASLWSSALLMVCLSPGFLVRLTEGQGFPFRDHLIGPFSHFFWAKPFPSFYHPHHDHHPLAVMRRSPGQAANTPGKSGPLELEQERKASAGVQNFGFSEDVAASAKESSPVIEHSPESSEQALLGLAPHLVKRPLDTIGSGFMKKEQVGEGMDTVKRELDHLGTGLMKRPLDHLGDGFLKKNFPFPEDGKNPFDKNEQEENFQKVNARLASHFEEKRTAVEMIKKGLDEVGAGLFKREGENAEGLTDIRTGLDQLSTSLGTGEPTKGIDAEMVRRGLDHLGVGLLKRGLDTVGIGFIKRGVENLDLGLSRNAPRRMLGLDGLGLLRKGLDSLAMVMIKNGFSTDAVNLVTTGTERLASWLIQHPSAMDFSPAADLFEDKKIELAKKDDEEFEPGLEKKTLDKLGTGFIKKGHSDKFESGFDKKSLDKLGTGLIKKEFTKKDNGEFVKKSLDKLGTGFIKKEFAKKTIDKSALKKKSLDKLGTGFIKKEFEEKNDDESGLKKKSLDKLGTGFIKKEVAEKNSNEFDKKSLDKLGTGFIKKEVQKAGPKFIKQFHNTRAEFNDDDMDDDAMSGLLINGDENGNDEIPFKKYLKHWEYKHKKDASNQKMHVHFKPGPKAAQDSKASELDTLSKVIKPDLQDKESSDVNQPPEKRRLDELGTGLIKKDLDYVGSGLIKKENPDSSFKKFDDAAVHKDKVLRHESPEEKNHQDEKVKGQKIHQAGDKSEKLALNPF